VIGSAFPQTPSTNEAKPEHLSNHQLYILLATAKTPKGHRRIAKYYEAKAEDFFNQAQDYERMIAAFKANPRLSANEDRVSTIEVCEYFVESFNDLARASKKLARLHEGMAKDADRK